MWTTVRGRSSVTYRSTDTVIRSFSVSKYNMLPDVSRLSLLLSYYYIIYLNILYVAAYKYLLIQSLKFESSIHSSIKQTP